jgi:hypothetical protein
MLVLTPVIAEFAALQPRVAWNLGDGDVQAGTC